MLKNESKYSERGSNPGNARGEGNGYDPSSARAELEAATNAPEFVPVCARVRRTAV